MNLEKAVNHGGHGEKPKTCFCFCFSPCRRVAVVNGFESVYFQPGRLKIKRVSYNLPPFGQERTNWIPAFAGMTVAFQTRSISKSGFLG
jgi:hypothetical protein